MEKLGVLDGGWATQFEKINELVETVNIQEGVDCNFHNKAKDLEKRLSKIESAVNELRNEKITAGWILMTDKEKISMLTKERDHLKELYIDQLRLNNFNNTHE